MAVRAEPSVVEAEEPGADHQFLVGRADLEQRAEILAQVRATVRIYRERDGWPAARRGLRLQLPAGRGGKGGGEQQSGWPAEARWPA
jgi:hypothetical protein